MTRARERLVFSRTPPSKSSPTPSWWSRVEALAPLWQPREVAAAQAAVGTMVSVTVLPTLVRSAPPVQARTDSEDRIDDSSARLGQAVHRLLEWATRAPVPAINRAALAQAAAAEFALDDAAAVLAIAARVLDSPHCARFLSGPSLRWAGNEVPLAGAGQVQRIDRLVQLDDGGASVWWVLDYKLASDPLADPALVAQLGAYRDAVRALQPGDAVRAAFITGQGEVVELD